MGTEFPYVRCFPKHKRLADGTVRSVYYLANFAGDITKVASSVPVDDNTFLYKMCAKFQEKYGHFFPVGQRNLWNSQKAMLRWADKMIWFSFLVGSNESMYNDFSKYYQGPCWFTKEICTDNWRGYTFLSDWDERFRNSSKSSVWILLKNRGKVWPVHVVHNQLTDGWPEFWDSHKLRSGFKVVFGCERSWIFEVVVLMHNLEPLYYSWSKTNHELQESSLMPYVADDLGTPRHLRTSCFPSMMSITHHIMQFGYDCASRKCITRVFGRRFRNLFHDTGADEISLNMRNKRWSICKIKNRVDRFSLENFFNSLNLQERDFVLVTAFDAANVNVLVFTGDGVERMYPWT
ncbi:hypothetical protein RHSIM_Rhsim03G0026300 [Rhododendron simsii]|uniref:Uncharacterized protein n=1 Tax=Rhododendron simsii TaxID=118357 RepID=A0A834H5M1_RHOSS|nr:hypothetical protein RHSIM_Rhsim11G0150300 [Rhododendron simsii]KAF7147332.1 hypothetical protein RHSIM_Rhsim03G0026300 [Rhododendron simsii]